MANMKEMSGLHVSRRSMLVTPELCIGCRACQVACKEWNKLPAERTKNRGTYENPPDLNQYNYTKIEYIEMAEPTRWLFVSRRCMHCTDAGCIKICPVPGAISKTREGAVVFNKQKCIGCKLCRSGCTFDIPRYDAQDKISKCTFCDDRLSAGLTPLCAKTCPTGAISFGDRKKLLATANAEGYKTIYGENDLSGLGVMFALKEKPDYYRMVNNPGLPGMMAFWHKVLRPLTVIGLGAAVTASALHYLGYGPDEVTPSDGGDA